MEEGLAYKVECFYNNYCVRDSNDRMTIVTKGELYDQLEWIKRDYSLYKFINENVKISETLTVSYIIYFSYGKFVIIV